MTSPRARSRLFFRRCARGYSNTNNLARVVKDKTHASGCIITRTLQFGYIYRRTFLCILHVLYDMTRVLYAGEWDFG